MPEDTGQETQQTQTNEPAGGTEGGTPATTPDGQTQGGTDGQAKSDPGQGGQPPTQTPSGEGPDGGEPSGKQTDGQKDGQKDGAPDDQKKVDEPKIPKPDEYKIPEGLPKELGQFAHKLGLTQEGLDETLKVFGGYIQARDTAQHEALKKLGEAHLKSWGDEAKTKLNLARQALKKNDPDGKLAEMLNQTGYGNHPAVLDFLANLGKQLEEGGFINSHGTRANQKKTIAQKLYPTMEK